MSPKNIVYIITFIRIPLAMLFIVCFQPDPLLLSIAFSAIVLAYISDLADGYLARKFSIASLEGQLWDSLADKAVYIAGAVAMNNQGILFPLIVWAMVFRDVFTFVTRVIYFDKIELIVPLKKLSYVHCVLIYLTILSGLYEMHHFIKYGSYSHIIAVNILAIITFICGLYPSIKFLSIK